MLLVVTAFIRLFCSFLRRSAFCRASLESKTHTPVLVILAAKIHYHNIHRPWQTSCVTLVRDFIFGDPGAVSGSRESLNRREKNSGNEKSRTRIRAPGNKVLTDQLQTVGVILASDWCQKIFVFFCPITEQQD